MAGIVHCCLVISSTSETLATYQEENEAQFPQTWSGIDIDSLLKIRVVQQGVVENDIRHVMELGRQNLPE